MGDVTFNILSPALKGQLTALQRTARAMDVAQLRLSTGKSVNSALDNPQNFFAARALSHQASDLQRMLDNIGQNIQVIKAADEAVKGITILLDQADSLTTEALVDLGSGSKNLSDVILADSPVAYWRLNETEGNAATNLGSIGAAVDGLYQNGVDLGEGEEMYLGGGDVNAVFDGINDRVRVADHIDINTDPAGYAEKTVEVIFNAHDLSAAAGRQVVFEEGGTVNALAIYVDDGVLYFSARDAGDYGPFNVNMEIEEGETYHAAVVIDNPNSEFRAYVNGELIGTETVTKPLNRHTADTGIGYNNGGTYFHDGAEGGNGEYFKGQISDVAIYRNVVTEEGFKERYATTRLQESKDYEAEFENIMTQLDLLVLDASYRGTNLVAGDVLTTYFNAARTSSLETEGGFLSKGGLGISDPSFRRVEDIETTFEELRTALETVRSFGSKLANNLSIIQTRGDMAEDMINTFLEGEDKLTLIDQNEESAKLLALQVRQSLQHATLAFKTTSIADFI